MDHKKFVLAIDQGTTSSRAVLFSAEGEMLAMSQQALSQSYPQKGWVEQDPEEIWESTLHVCREVFKIHDDAHCAAIGISNQRETTILWDRSTGKPIYNAIVWQDRRTASFCNELVQAGREAMVTAKTGLLIDPYFSCSKIKWILDHVKGARGLAETGRLAFGTVDCFLLWRLTGGASHLTDATNASRTGLFNIINQDWDDELLALYDIPRAILPQVKDTIFLFGQTVPGIFNAPIMVAGMAGDQQAALIGQGCFGKGMMKSTYGTGCFALMNIGENFKVSRHRLLTTIAYRIDGRPCYALEGSIFTAGAAIQWMRDNLQLINSAEESEALAYSVANSNGVFFIPALTGLGAPYWRADARASITGLTRDTSKAHIVRAALEAQAYQTVDLMQAMEKDSHIVPDLMRADGGLMNNKFVCQFLADMIQAPVEVPEIKEISARGAAILAGIYAGFYQDFNDPAILQGHKTIYEPQTPTKAARQLQEKWAKNMAFFLHQDF